MTENRPLTAGKLIGEVAGATRFKTDAQLARPGFTRVLAPTWQRSAPRASPPPKRCAA